MAGQEYRMRYSNEPDERDIIEDAINEVAYEVWQENNREEDFDVLYERMSQEFEEKRGLESDKQPGWMGMVQRLIEKNR